MTNQVVAAEESVFPMHGHVIAGRPMVWSAGERARGKRATSIERSVETISERALFVFGAPMTIAGSGIVRRLSAMVFSGFLQKIGDSDDFFARSLMTTKTPGIVVSGSIRTITEPEEAIASPRRTTWSSRTTPSGFGVSMTVSRRDITDSRVDPMGSEVSSSCAAQALARAIRSFRSSD